VASQRLQTAVPLRFVANSGHRPLDLHFDRDDNTIVVPLGMSTGMLRSFLNLEFYFFHEYVSHVFCLYRDKLDEFPEGFLMAVERRYYTFAADTYAQVILSKDDFDAHQRRILGLGASSFYDDSLEFAAWLMERCDDRRRIAGLMLDLAATPKENALHRLFLRRFRGVSRSRMNRLCQGLY
jgi:hypothetical protein